jgi:hypothetical protein
MRGEPVKARDEFIALAGGFDDHGDELAADLDRAGEVGDMVWIELADVVRQRDVVEVEQLHAGRVVVVIWPS